jgi:hypothetical protein
MVEKLNLVRSVQESPIRSQLTEEELFILISWFANPKNRIAAMTAAGRQSQRMLQWVQTGNWLQEY